MRPAAGGLLVAILLAPVVASAQAPGAPGGSTVDITGATYVEFERATGVWKAEGGPLTVSRGHTVLRTPRVRFDERARVVVAEGGVELTEPGMTVLADAAELRLADDHVSARGDVRVTSTRDGQPATLRAPEASGSLRTRRFSATGGVVLGRGDATLTGRRLDYDDAGRVAVVTGDPQGRYRDATLSAEIVTLFLDQEVLRGEGSPQVRRGDLVGSARRVEIHGREGLGRLVGDARVERGRERVTADEIDMALDGSRITTRGRSRIVVLPP